VAITSVPAAAREFLRYWALRDRGQLAAEPERVVDAMDPATRQVIYVAAEDLLDEIAHEGPITTEPGEVAVYLNPTPHEEYRWQLAAMLADTVVLNRAHWAPGFGFYSLREVCTRPDGDPEAAASALAAVTPSGDSEEAALVADQLMIEKSLGLLDDKILTSENATEWRDAAVPAALANILRFLAHLSAVGDGARVILSTFDLQGALKTWHSLEWVYFIEGKWGYAYPWTTLPPGVRAFEEIINEIGPDQAELLVEVIWSYALGSTTSRGHLPLVPSTPRCHRTAVQFYRQIHRLFFHPFASGIPQAVPLKSGTSPDWRPAFCDEILIAAFPNVATADLSTFEYLHELRALDDFRHRLRADAKEMSISTAAEAEERLIEVSAELRKTARAATTVLESAISADRKNIILTNLASAVITGVGFISFGPVAAIGSGIAAGSLTAALQSRQLDRSAKFTGTELALLTLGKGRRPRGL
jgi:hypothetical protein